MTGGAPLPQTIAVQLPSWPGKPNIVYYSTIPPDQFNDGNNALNQAEEEAREKKKKKTGPTLNERRLEELREFKDSKAKRADAAVSTRTKLRAR